MSRFRLVARVHLTVPIVAALLAWAPPAAARITRIVIDTKISPAFGGADFPTGSGRVYEQLIGRAFGELDPNNPNDAIIQDLNLAPKNAKGHVEYMATFQITKPIDMTSSSHLMWHDVPNRGGRITIGTFDRNNGDIGLSSGWQGDNIGGTLQTTPGRDTVTVPVATNPDGSSITGPVFGRLFNHSGPNSQTPMVYVNPMPYAAASLDTSQATLESHDAESDDGVFYGVQQIPSTDWAWASCSAANPFPGTPDPRQICLKNGYDPKKLYQVHFIAKDPYVLGMGFAAFRDMASFLKYQTQDDVGTPSPLAGGVSWIISRGISQSGNFIRQFIHLGMNQDESGRQVHDGAEPHVAGRRLVMNVRFATPDQILSLFNGGSEGPVWYAPAPDPLRGLPTAGILDRCTASNTCPKLVEYNGATEFWGLHYSPDLVGIGADQDLPLPDTVRRYYIASTPHNGGAGGFNVNGGNVPNGPPSDWGACTFNGNQMPYTQTVNALTMQFRDWVMHGTPMVPSRYPTLAAKTLVDPTKDALGFPSIPAVIASTNPIAPDGIINTIKDYDFGPRFNATDQSGIYDFEPPTIDRIFPSKAPRVDADGNELGGVPVVLRAAPLGTYLGWNITSVGFFSGHLCSYANGYIPFTITKQQRTPPGGQVQFHYSVNGNGGGWSAAVPPAGDPRLSLEERYGTHAGYVAAVTAAANDAVAQRFLLPTDAAALIAQADASSVLTVLPPPGPPTGEVVIGPQGGNVTVNPGDTLSAGYRFKVTGQHPTVTMSFTHAAVTFQPTCAARPGPWAPGQSLGPILVPMADQSYGVAQNSPAFVPSSDSVFQGSISVPDLCNGGPISLKGGGTFTSIVSSN